ncbi:MAG: hypothetical protein Q9163_004355 [Psora crenata]
MDITDANVALHMSQDLANGSDLDSGSQRIVTAHDTMPMGADADIDRLIQRMNDHVVIKDMAVTVATMTRKEIRMYLKRNRRGSLIPNTAKGQWNNASGFRPQEVNLAGAVSLASRKLSNLENKIHPLLFDDTPDAMYDQFTPALRLTTMFLIQPVSMQFWVTLALGERLEDSEMSLNMAGNANGLGNTGKVITHLRELGESNIIQFAFRDKLLPEFGRASGSLGPIYDYHGSKEDSHTHDSVYYQTAHRQIHYREEVKPIKYPGLSQILRFSFFFANL